MLPWWVNRYIFWRKGAKCPELYHLASDDSSEDGLDDKTYYTDPKR